MVEPEREALDALISWRASRVETDLGAVPDEGLWHYTDANGLMGILEKEQLWASDARFLNDATEFHYGLRVAEEAVEAVARSEQWSQSTSHFLRRVMASNGANLTGFLRARSQVYVACLCEDGDLLSQWRAYASRETAGGYALQLRHRAPLTGWIDHRGRTTLRIHRVMYDRDEQLAAFSDLVERLAPVYDIDPTERRQAALGQTLVDGILELASYCKHPQFQRGTRMARRIRAFG